MRVLLMVPIIMLKFYRHTRRGFSLLSVSRAFGRLAAYPEAHSFFVWFPILLQKANVATTQGFDEFMNIVLDEAAEVYVKQAKPRRELGM